MKDNIIYNKSFDFAVKVVTIYERICSEKREYIISKQFLRSGTSIGANVREGIEAQSKKDFISKLSIALKEACETEYWIELLIATDYLNKEDANTLLNEIKEIIKILNAIIKTSKKKVNKDIC